MAEPNYYQINAGRDSLNHTQQVFDSAFDDSSDKMASRSLAGAESAKGLLRDGNEFNKSLGSSDPALSQAIRNRYIPQMQHESAKLASDVKRESQDRYVAKLRDVSESVQQEQDMNYQRALAKYKHKLAKKNGRAAIIGQVVGVVGGVVGGIYGGPGGAMAGYQVGNMAGTGLAGGSTDA